MGKKISIKEIAKLSGVSVSTVSRVINNNGRFSEETRQRVLKIIKKYNYHTNTLAKGLRMKRSNTIGIIVPELSNTFFSSLVEKIENQFFSKNYATIICDTGRNADKEAAYIRMLEAKLADGLIIISGKKTFDASLLSRTIPVVCIDRKPNDKKIIFISSNHYQGAVIATTELLEAGTQPHLFKVAGSSSSMLDRIKGFKDTLQNKQQLDERAIISLQADYPAGSNARRLEIRTELRQLMSSEQLPLGIFATSDTLAADIMIAARELHLNIPADLKIIGFDDAPIARYCYPQLTTIHQDITEIASQASQHLIAAINNSENIVEEVVTDTIIDVHLVRRGTV
ncbi:LacI family DNA-binding transcriptional regulator [Liquorilactobacillus capillatus]|uniref:LacI family transcription regulator n=1 Tax=Liquorilactobacillus capillatus DSM 19910 TaxID=1423731 RepID=A0A0R1M1E4_9LACO|nr:LacI family DNA-binding transcriptional regulator [Liquorilactobacillus capillatus]KRL01489.1 LacI family transcription regulator [Liquorilactobacillus capillatus DSM 19910]